MKKIVQVEKKVNTKRELTDYQWQRLLELYLYHNTSIKRLSRLTGWYEKAIADKFKDMGYTYDDKLIIQDKQIREYVAKEGYKVLTPKDTTIRLGGTMKVKCPKGHITIVRVPNFVIQHKRCLKCSERLATYNFANAEKYKDIWKDIPATVYIAELTKGSESFFKVGLTTNLRARLYKIPYQCIRVHEIPTNLYSGVYLEDYLIKYHEDYKVVPKLDFKGKTECFSLIKLNDYVHFPRFKKVPLEEFRKESAYDEEQAN